MFFIFIVARFVANKRQKQSLYLLITLIQIKMIVESKKFNAYLLSELRKELGEKISMDVRIVLSKNVGRTMYHLYFYLQAPNHFLEYQYQFNEGWVYDAISNNDEDVIICIFERITEGLTLLYNDINNF